jgi:hypothetical protein
MVQTWLRRGNGSSREMAQIIGQELRTKECR